MSRTAQSITYTAVFMALIVVCQYFTSFLGQMVTGSAVNLLLITACLIAGWKPGAVVGILSPVFAKLIGIGPVLPLLPAVALGNLAIVASYHLTMKLSVNKNVKWIIAVVTGAVLKFAVLYLGIVEIAIPFLQLPEEAGAKMSAMFGVSQLITALIGGICAVAAVPLIRRATRK